MKAVILAGGLGTRLFEETDLKPKPMVEIGGKPIIWHIMKIYSYYGVNEFIICCGYKGYLIKEYFANYFLHQANVTFQMHDNSMNVHQNNSEPWTVTLVDTGENTMTGGRLKRVKDFIKDDTFCVVGYSSNALVEAAMLGIPVISLGHSATKSLYTHQLEDIEKIKPAYQSDKQAWLNHLAYSQFTREELLSGLAWELIN